MTYSSKRTFSRRAAYIIAEYTVREGRFRKIDTTGQVNRATEALLNLLEADAEIHDVRWSSD